MRSLEEVIMCLEGCGMIDCNDCPYHYKDEKIEVDDCDQAYKDALQWLKEYQEKQYQLSAMFEEYQSAVAENPNEPLTWDELTAMKGRPVWIEADNGHEQFKHWFLIDDFTFSGIQGLQIMWCLNYNFRFWEKDLGETWQAYRKERSA